jgi:hypothetical protein
MIQRIFTFPLVLAAVLVTGACSSMEVSDQVDPNANLSEYKTFAWATPKTPPAQQQQAEDGPNQITDREIKNAVAAELSEIGIQKAPEGTTPDFYVTYTAGTHEDTAITNDGLIAEPGFGAPIGWSEFDAPVNTVTEWEEGDLTLQFFDAKTNENFWNGFSSAAIDAPGENQEEIDSAVTKMIEKFQEERTKKAS